MKEQCARKSARCNLSDVDYVSLPAIAIKSLALARIVDHILRQPLADYQANQRFTAVIDRLVRRSSPGQTDEIAWSNLMCIIANEFGSMPGQNIDRFVLVFVRVKLRRLVARRDR